MSTGALRHPPKLEQPCGGQCQEGGCCWDLPLDRQQGDQIKSPKKKLSHVIRFQEKRYRVVSLFSGILGLELGLAQPAAQQLYHTCIEFLFARVTQVRRALCLRWGLKPTNNVDQGHQLLVMLGCFPSFSRSSPALFADR